MSVMDGGLEFSNAQALGAISDGNSVKSTNIIDLGASHLDAWDDAKSPELGGSVFNVNVAVVLVGASSTIRAQLVSKAADASISSGGTVHEEVLIPAVSVAGIKRSLKITPGTVFNRYVGVLFTAAGANLTTASFDAWLGLDAEARG